MILILSYIINLLAPIVNILGAIGLFGCMAEGEYHIFIISGVMAVVGLVFGVFAYHLDIPPRWFWSKSKNELFNFSVTAVLGYAVNFAMWPFAIRLIMYFF